MLDITCSIVLYHTDENELEYILDTLLQSELKLHVYLIDNSKTDALKKLVKSEKVTYIFNNANLGYGVAHNIAIREVNKGSKYHLIINADIEFDPGILKKAFDYMEFNKNVVMLSPLILTPTGNLQYFCRKLPTPSDLIARRFVPSPLHGLIKQKLDDYVLRHKDYMKPMNIPNLPGCFMFVRNEALQQVGGFDENFFMYVEDVDLTRRLHEIGRTMYYPSVSIVHGLARGSYKLSKLLIYHVQSAIYYFNKWGWFTDKKRRKINDSL